MRFEDLEIIDLNGEEEKVISFPSDQPSEKQNNEDDEKIDWKKE